jgi:hypothetical protein
MRIFLSHLGHIKICLNLFSGIGMAIFFFDNPGCPGQLARTTTIPRVYWTSCKPSRQVRHRGGDRRAHGELNSGRGQGKPHLLTTELDPQMWHGLSFLYNLVVITLESVRKCLYWFIYRKVKKSNHVRRKLEKRQQTRELDPHIEEQFGCGSLMASISSRSGQCGRADGYATFFRFSV